MSQGAAPDAYEAWLLTADERGNPATAIDAEHAGGRAWTVGNHVTVHVDGAAYFARLHQLLSGLEAGDWVYLTDWRIDATRQLAGPGSELGPLLAGLAGRGVAIRGLLWRSHPALVRFNQDANRVLSTLVNRAGGQLVADQRVRRFGSHHQKLLVVHRPNDPVRCIAFVGGIDLSRGRADSPGHQGDDDPVRIDPRYGPRPPWHDLQLELAGPAVLDVDLTFRERWEDRTPPDHRNPLRAMWRQLSHEPRRLGLLQRRPPPPQAGSHAVQVLRTYPARRRVIPFAPDGERSIARAYLKALGRARSLVYIEDQYLWGHPGRRRPRGGPAPRPRAAHDARAATPSGPRRADLRPGRPGRPVAGHQQPHRRRGAASDRLRPGERAGHPDLRPRQGRGDRRRVGDDRLGQPQPPLLDPRLRGRLRGPRPAARPSPPNRPGRPRRWSQGVRPSAPAPPVARAPRARGRRRRHSTARPGRRLRGLAGGRGQAPGLARRRPPRPRPPGRIRPHQVELAPALKARWAAALYRVAIDPDGRPLPLRRDTSL